MVIYLILISARKSRWSDAPEKKTNNFSNVPTTPIDILPTSDIISISEKLRQINPILSLNSQSDLNINNPNANIIYTLNDCSKIKCKVFIPKVQGVNFVGLLIGPKGTYQKRLEAQTNCKILIRGK